MVLVYLWLLIVVIALCAGLFVWLERRHDRWMRNSVQAKEPLRELSRWDSDASHDDADTQPSVLDPIASEGRRRRAR